MDLRSVRCTGNELWQHFKDICSFIFPYSEIHWDLQSRALLHKTAFSSQNHYRETAVQYYSASHNRRFHIIKITNSTSKQFLHKNSMWLILMLLHGLLFFFSIYLAEAETHITTEATDEDHTRRKLHTWKCVLPEKWSKQFYELWTKLKWSKTSYTQRWMILH